MARSSREANETIMSGYLIKTVSAFFFLDAADVNMLSEMRSSFRCPRFVVDESPRTLKVPMMKFEGGRVRW